MYVLQKQQEYCLEGMRRSDTPTDPPTERQLCGTERRKREKEESINTSNVKQIFFQDQINWL